MIVERIKNSKLLPVIALENAKDAIPLCQALQEGGLQAAEITCRTAAACDAIALVAAEFPDFILGAGTVTQLAELKAVKKAGAQFALAPGFNPDIVKASKEMDMPFFPGICTPSELEAAYAAGCKVVKFFPAGAMGGTNMIKNLYGPYRHLGIEFIPTGGINAKNLAEYLAQPGVIAAGGSWFVNNTLIANQDWQTITQLTKEALASIS